MRSQLRSRLHASPLYMWYMRAGSLMPTFYEAIEREARYIEVCEVPISIPHLPPQLDGFRIVQLSDLHSSLWVRETDIRQAIQLANELKPDLVVLTGDYVTDDVSHIDSCVRLLRNLHARHGVYAILGNHDMWTNATLITSALEDIGIPVLRNRHVAIEHEGARLWLAGVDDLWEGEDDISAALTGIPIGMEGTPTILLSHNPELIAKLADQPVDLMLSGHTHGGQVRVPFVQHLLSRARKVRQNHQVNKAARVEARAARTAATDNPARIARQRKRAGQGDNPAKEGHGTRESMPKGTGASAATEGIPIHAAHISNVPRRYIAGLYRQGRTHVYVNRGIGVAGVPMRVGVPSEVTLLRLLPEK